MKKIIALILSIMLMWTALNAMAENEVELEFAPASETGAEGAIEDGLYVVGEVGNEDGIVLEEADGIIPLEDELALDGLNASDELELDGLNASNGLGVALTQEEDEQEADAGYMAGNESNPEDFEIDANGVLVKYRGNGGDVIIPDGVTSIGESAFEGCRNLTSVTIPDGVTGIGESAFEGCESLTSVTIPDSVTSIGRFAFVCCKRLESVTIPFSVISIGNQAFYQCGLTDVIIPDNVTRIGYGTFMECTNLWSVVIPDRVISIDDSAFSDCSKLTSVTIGSGVTSIGDYAFSGCTSLKGITVPDNVTDIGEGAFKECEELKNVTIGKGVLVIPAYCFKQCRSLLSVVLPDGFFYIDDEAFSDCINLKSVHIGIPLDPMEGAGSLIIVDDPSEFEEAFESIAGRIQWQMFLGTYFPDYPIHDNAFSGCSKDLTFYTRCDTSPTERAKELGYNVVQSDHSPAVIKGEAPTETEYGKTDGVYCSACGMILVEQEDIPPLGSTSKINLSQCKITVKPQVYTGKTLKPSVKVVLNKKTLKKGTDYTVTYKNNKAIGTATVTVKGKGSYTGTKKATFKINPKAVTGLKLTAGKGLINAGWKKSAGGVGGYQLQYSLKKSFSGAKKVTVAKAATVKKVLKGLATGKTYYVRIRAYKKVGKTTYYSAWSAAKTAKVK